MGRFSKLELDDKKQQTSKEVLYKAMPIEEGYDQDYYLQQANEYYRKGEFEKALRYYSRALGIDNTLVAAWVGQVRALIDLKETREAHVWVNKALEFFPGEAELLAAKAVVYAKLGLNSQAIAISDLSFEQKVLTTYVWFARGQVLLAKTGKNAEFCFQKAIEMSKDDWFMYQMVGMAYMEKKHYSRAQQYLSEAASRNSANPFLWLQVGLCCQHLGFYPRAMKCFQQALEINPRYKPAEKALTKAKHTRYISRLFHWVISPFRS